MLWRRVLLALTLFSCSVLAQTHYKIIYTGRLFGYARVPDAQRFDSHSGSGDPNAFAAALLSQLPEKRDNSVLVGMGDNLAPDLLARSFDLTGFSVPNCDGGAYPPSLHVPKDFFRYGGSSWQSVCSNFKVNAPFFDNAAEFFIRGKFDAVTVGKQDFYLGAQHLRDVAAFLDQHGVPMLASNLIVQTTRARKTVPFPFPHSQYQSFAPASVDVPSVVLPWKQRFLIHNAAAAKRDWSKTEICAEDHCWPIRPARDVCPNPPEHLKSTCRALSPDKGNDLTFVWATKEGHLTAGVKHLLCNGDACQPFTVSEPLFQKPYAFAHGVAIFAVVDPDLLANVGLLNASWLNRDRDLDTVSATTTPVDAIYETLDLCQADDACRTAPKILLAHMSHARAEQLMSHFKSIFDVVISAADASFPPAISRVDTQAKRPAFVLTPPIPFGHDELDTKLYTASIGHDGDHWKLDNQPLSASAKPIQLNAPSHSPDLVDTTLQAMRRYLDTDVAMLQRRDFFDAGTLSSEPVQDQISTILWKGDFISKLHVTGATLRALLKQSAAFDALDSDPLSVDIERGRGLLTLGITHDAGDPSTYYVNGTKLDDAALYTVAATDYLSAGDTGYGALASPDVPPPLRPASFDKGPISLAALVCHTIAPDGPCLPIKLGTGYMDKTTQQAVNTPPNFTTWQHYEALPHYFDLLPAPGSGPEKKVQERRFWTFALENLDFGANGVFIDHVTRTTSLLAGISTPGIAQYNTSNIAADHRARFTVDWRWGTMYLMSDSMFMSTRTAPGTLSISTNMLGSEAGGTFRVPEHRPSWLSLQYSIRFERELVQPPDTIFGSLSLPSPQTSDVYGRLGLRAESTRGVTFFETGVEEIDARNLLASYAFGSVVCTPSASIEFVCNGAIPSGVRPITNTENFLTSGAYMNFRFRFPLLSRMSETGADRSIYFTLSNKGDLYFNSPHDTPVQTRYLTQLTPALAVPIWGNFSLTPKVDFILFENKVNFYHYRAIQPSVSLSYSFRMREGMDWKRALGFGAQTTTQQTPGSLP